MSAQVSDIYHYNGEIYKIVAASEEINFNPADYGITPVAMNSGCWRGYWCEYEISDTGIVLQKLHINSKDNYYPAINGIKESRAAKKNKKILELITVSGLYENLDLAIGYTGRIVAGYGFLQDYYVHMGYQRAWGYTTLTEFVFEDGRLIDTIDHSETAVRLREDTKSRRDESENIKSFINDSFSLDFKIKCWWLL